ncbi:MAG: hypothetical protein GF353_07895 [Candidatus Lokiarchaeota archaeon]|nr:hypothetical protein [Candidatus Lokiarchaeota archaeon]
MVDRKERLKQLKFIASIFKMSMEEFNKVMGPETIQTVFRLIGENQGKAIEERIRKKYDIKQWTPELFAEKLVQEVFEPAIGKDNSEITRDGDELTVIVKACPFKKAGIDISDKFYCTYTQGLVETVAKETLQDISFKTECLQSTGETECIFKIQLI